MIKQNYIQALLDTDYLNWPDLYPNNDHIIDELEEELILNKGVLPNTIKNKIFWFFRDFFSSYKNKLSKIQAKKLYGVLLIILQQDDCLRNLRDTDLSILEEILIILERMLYIYPDLKGDITILNPIIKAASLKKELKYTKNAGTFIAKLLSCFKIYLQIEKITKSIELIHSTQALQELFDKQLVWNKNDPDAMLMHGLFFLKDLRCIYKEHSEICSAIDRYAIKLCDMAIHNIPKTFSHYSIEFIQEDIGAAYVKYLEPDNRDLFNGTYKILYPKDVLSQVDIHTLVGASHLPTTHITMNHTGLSLERNNKVLNLVNELHLELNGFLSSINIRCLELNEIHIQLNLFKHQKQFERYAYLVWNVDSSGGGICIPAENNQPTTAFVYQSDQGFESLKHELTHAFMDNIFGNPYADYLSGVFTEGIAVFFDIGASNLNKLIQMQRMLLKEPLKALPEIVTMNEGGSVVSLYGYFWITYLVEENLSILANILSEVQNKNQYQVSKLIEHYGIEQKGGFNNWMQNKLSQLIIHLFKAIRQQDRGSVNQLLAGMNNQRVNIQEAISKNTSLHIAIEIWIQLKNDITESRTTIALNIIWSLLLKGAELKNVRNAKGKSPLDLIENKSDRELIEKYAMDAKHYIYLENIPYTERKMENITIC
ncbi:MAG: collagenase [Candidatus Aquirickettsiella sp.]